MNTLQALRDAAGRPAPYTAKYYHRFLDSTELDYRLPFCDSCRIHDKEREKRDMAERAAIVQVDRQTQTQEFIEAYLDPEKTWNADIETSLWFKRLQRHISSCYTDTIAAYIIKLPYNDFLSTPYWKAVAREVRYKNNFCCTLCSSSCELNVHHRTYEHHGYEHAYLKDLVCLCRHCHAKFHDKAVIPSKKPIPSIRELMEID